jgi:hypothetical protein
MQALSIRVAGIGIDAVLRQHIRSRLQHKLDRFAGQIARSSVLIATTSSRAGDIDMACHIDFRLSKGAHALRIEQRGATPREAFDRAATVAERALALELERDAAKRSPVALADAAVGPEQGRRESWVDTAQPGVSASARKVGSGSTGRRNIKRNLAGLTSALEDSAAERPSRKSTRRSENRAKRDSNLERRQSRKVSAPKERARRSWVQAGKRVH